MSITWIFRKESCHIENYNKLFNFWTTIPFPITGIWYHWWEWQWYRQQLSNLIQSVVPYKRLYIEKQQKTSRWSFIKSWWFLLYIMVVIINTNPKRFMLEDAKRSKDPMRRYNMKWSYTDKKNWGKELEKIFLSKISKYRRNWLKSCRDNIMKDNRLQKQQETNRKDFLETHAKDSSSVLTRTGDFIA